MDNSDWLMEKLHLSTINFYITFYNPELKTHEDT
jgi:hypothetical protein